MTIKIDGTNGITFPDNTVQSTATASLGYGQTYQDVTVLRSAGTTYTNSTNRPIFVSILEGQSGNSGGNLYVNDLLISAGYASAVNLNCTVSGIVPINSTYRYTNNASGGSIVKWVELR